MTGKGALDAAAESPGSVDPGGPDAPLDPRVARSRAKVVTATIELLGTLGFGGTTVERIAERSGVAKTTIYRHWSSREDLVFDAIAAVMPPPEPPDTGSLEGDLRALVDRIIGLLWDADLAPIWPTMIDAAERDAGIEMLNERFIDRTRMVVTEVLRRAVERGEISPPRLQPEELVALLHGPLVFSRLMLRRTPTPAVIDRAVASVLATLA